MIDTGNSGMNADTFFDAWFLHLKALAILWVPVSIATLILTPHDYGAFVTITVLLWPVLAKAFWVGLFLLPIAWITALTKSRRFFYWAILVSHAAADMLAVAVVGWK